MTGHQSFSLSYFFWSPPFLTTILIMWVRTWKERLKRKTNRNVFLGGRKLKGSYAKQQTVEKREMFYNNALISLADSFEMKPKFEWKVEDYKLPPCQYKQKQLPLPSHYKLNIIEWTVWMEANVNGKLRTTDCPLPVYAETTIFKSYLNPSTSFLRAVLPLLYCITSLTSWNE